MDEENKKYIIISVSLLAALLINYFLFKLSFILSLIYDIILFILLYLYFYCGDEEIFGNWKEKISIGLMSESIIISFHEFYYTQQSWFFFTENVKVTIAPNMLTLIVSILYAVSLKLRNNVSFSNKLKDIIMNIMNILFFASLISVCISNDYFYIPLIGETNFTAQSFCIILLVFSWTGMKIMNLFIFPIIAFLSLTRIVEVDRAMGFTGLIYLLCAYLSICFQCSSSDKMGKIWNIYKNIPKDFPNELLYKDNNNNNNQLYEQLV